MYAPVLMYYSCDFDFAEIHILGMLESSVGGSRFITVVAWFHHLPGINQWRKGKMLA